jgi:anti-anti-sigma factor
MPETAEPTLFTTRQQDGATVVEIRTDNLLALADLNRLGPKLIEQAASGDNQKLVLDLSKVRYAGSAALGLLLKMDGELKQRNGKLILIAAGAIDGLLRVSRTKNLFQIAPDLNAATKLG